jgi:hypothetical protein
MKKFLIALLGLFLLLSPAKAQLTQAQVNADINSMLTSCGNGCNTAATLRALLDIMAQATFFPATVQMPNAFPQPIVDLQTVVPTNGFYTSGSGSIYRNCPLIGCLSGDHQRSALYLKSTATFDASIAEYMVTFDCNLNSGSTGTPVGPGGFSNSKVCLFNSATTGSSAGANTWGMANDLVIGAGDTGAFKVSAEFDLQNNGADCAVGVRNCYTVFLSGNVANPITAFLAVAPTGTTLNAHYGLLVNDTPGTDIEVGLGMLGHFATAAIQIPAGEKICYEITSAVCMSWDATNGVLSSTFTLNAPYVQTGTTNTISGSGTLTGVACTAARLGLRSIVSNGVASPALGSVVSTTGAVVQPVVCSGASGNWVYG